VTPAGAGSRRRAFRIFLAAVSALLALALAAEAALRLRPPLAFEKRRALAGVGSVHPPGLLLPDPDLGWVMAPDFEGACAGPGWTMSVRTNSLGLRDREFPPDPDRVRVVVLGDSYVFGQGVGPEEAFPKVAERILRGRGRGNVDVVNAGVAGYGPKEESGLMGRLWKSLEPRVVVLAFFEGNDLRDALSFPVPTRLGPDGILHRRTSGPQGAPMTYLAAYVGMKIRFYQEKRETGRGMQEARRSIGSLNKLVGKLGGRFLLVLVPARRSSRAARPALLRLYDRLLGVPGDVNAEMEAHAREEGIPVLNLSPIFDAAPDEETLRFRLDANLKPEGHALAGKALADALEPLLP
jgi:lysophospholipase L1-like esterase